RKIVAAAFGGKGCPATDKRRRRDKRGESRRQATDGTFGHRRDRAAPVPRRGPPSHYWKIAPGLSRLSEPSRSTWPMSSAVMYRSLVFVWWISHLMGVWTAWLPCSLPLAVIWS